MSRNLVVSGFNFKLLLNIQYWTVTSEFLRFLVDFSKLDVLKELWTCVSSAYRWCLISLAFDRTELSGVVYILKKRIFSVARGAVSVEW